MNFEKVANAVGLIIGLATVTVVLTSPLTAGVIKAAGDALIGSVRAAMGK